MYLVYVGEVLKRAFTPAPRVTDMLQILAASALPATSKFIGFELPTNAGENVLAYIGLVAISFVVIRLFWAPYAMWHEQVREISNLRSEISKPERLVIEHLARHRAKARKKLSSALQEFQLISFSDAQRADDTDQHFDRCAHLMHRIVRLQAEAGLSESFNAARQRLLNVVLREADMNPEDFVDDSILSLEIVKLMQRYLVGDITAEALALQLPPYTELEKQP